MRQTYNEVVETIQSGFQMLADMKAPYSEAEPLFAYLFKPDKVRLEPRLQKLLALHEKSKPSVAEKKQKGELLEQFVWILLEKICDIPTNRRSFQGAGPQIDVVVDASCKPWMNFKQWVGMPEGRISLFAECKATKERLADKVVSRATDIVSLHMKSVGIIVFFSLNGGKGWGPRSVGGAALRQLLFYASHGVPVVVLDKDDLPRCCEPGGVVTVLCEKVKALQELRLPNKSAWKEGEAPSDVIETTNLPAHLAELA